VIVGIKKGSGITGAMRYVKGEGRDDVTGELKQRVGDNSRAELLGGQGFGFEIKSEADVELARRVMEFAGKPENQASKTRPCELDCEHITLSWAKAQRPDNAEKIAAARGVLGALGMSNARAVFYAHHDADYAHIHIVASRLDPDTRRAYSAHEDIFKSQAWALQWEREHDQIVPSRQWMHTLADAARRSDYAALRAALTVKEATFSRKDVDRAFAWAGYFGSERTKPRDTFLAEREIVPLRERADGPVKAYTTRAILAEERAVQRDARALHERRGFGLKLDTVAAQGIKYGLKQRTG
jgi:Relaxase/Mobilisation nuclease domain